MSQLAPGATSSAPAAYRSRLYALLSAAYRYPSAEWCQVVACGQFQARVQQAAAGLPYPLPSSPDSPELKVLSPESRGSTQDSALSTQDSALRTPQDSALALPLSGLSSASLATAYTHLFDVGSLAGPPCCLYEGE
ncbi:MAG: hypothetical protein HY690_11520 [Chloroflexi bacterium]|nr:hypothetical protein [Chloroflexota bacterium]